MKIVFMGTPEFAIPSLKMLLENNYNIVCVITQPDKPKGRGHNLAMPPVKEFAIKSDLEVLQPEKVRTKDFIDKIKDISPDILITAAYGKILPKDILDIPKLGCINVHASLLPKYRGAAPINWAIINGEKKTGITTMYTDVGMDTGDILLKKEIEILRDMTAGQLHDKLSVLGAQVLSETLYKLQNGTLIRTPQNNEESSYAPMIKKELGCIDWSKTPVEIHNLIRGTNPWPGAFCFYNKSKMNIWKADFIEDENIKMQFGAVYKVTKEGVWVACKGGFVNIFEIQLPSSKKMSIKDYLCGHKIFEGEIFE